MMKLEIGCGGSETFQYVTHGDVNLDIRRPLSKISNFVLADAHYLPFQSESFEQVHAHHVIEHLRSPQQTLEECYRILKFGGKILVETPNAIFILKVLRSIKRGFYTVDNDHIATYGFPEIKQLLQRTGFQRVNITYATSRRGKFKIIELIILRLCPFRAIKHYHLVAVGLK